MQEIKCPKCGEVFQVDETGYAAIVKQVRDEEFHREIHERLEQFEKEKNASVELAKTATAKAYDVVLAKKAMEINDLKSQLNMQKMSQAHLYRTRLTKKNWSLRRKTS